MSSDSELKYQEKQTNTQINKQKAEWWKLRET